MMPISEGSIAPDFELPAVHGETVRLSDYRGKANVVMYFYPKDMTSGCTKEACNFRDLRHEFDEAGAVILGVSRDDLESHSRFAGAYGLDFPLLSDVDGEICQAYGVYKEKTLNGHSFMGIERTTFVIDRDGIVRKLFPQVKVDQHADQVLDFVRNMRVEVPG